jgi:hypothetical protein
MFRTFSIETGDRRRYPRSEVRRRGGLNFGSDEIRDHPLEHSFSRLAEQENVMVQFGREKEAIRVCSCDCAATVQVT